MVDEPEHDHDAWVAQGSLVRTRLHKVRYSAPIVAIITMVVIKFRAHLSRNPMFQLECHVTDYAPQPTYQRVHRIQIPRMMDAIFDCIGT
jgi:hypothetical protein